MPLLSQPAFGPRTAIIYITIGSLIDVWTAVWYFTFARDDTGNISRNTWFWLVGLFLSGITLIVIGILLGEIGRSARKAEMLPREAQAQEATIQATAAAHPQPVVAGGVPAVGATTAGVTQAPANPMTGALPAGTPMQPAAPAPQPYVPGVTRR
jgi:hypothetical protein